MTVLVDEQIISFAVFNSLREEHFEKLLPRLKVGQHALLYKLWDVEVKWTDLSCIYNYNYIYI